MKRKLSAAEWQTLAGEPFEVLEQGQLANGRAWIRYRENGIICRDVESYAGEWCAAGYRE